MKKIVNYIVLIVVCLLPVMVDAKVNLEFNKEYDNEAFLFEDEGIYYFPEELSYDGDFSEFENPDIIRYYYNYTETETE